MSKDMARREGSAISTEKPIADPIADPLRTPDEDQKWLSATAIADLAGIAERVARRAIKSGRWRGVDLVVREVAIGRGGASGKALQVHVDSLPADLRAAWYLGKGIDINAKPAAGTSEVIAAPEELALDPVYERKLERARARLDIIRPLIEMGPWARGRQALLKEIAAEHHSFPGGVRKKVSGQTLYN